MIASINDYRSRAGLPPLVWDGRLATNALRTGQATGGASLAHMMLEGTMAQVLVQGENDASCGKDFGGYSPFELSYLSWLCESPGDPGLAGRCGDVLSRSGIASGGQTAHHEILSDPKYRSIGCAFSQNPSAGSCSGFNGVWACDLA
jgi:cysteine-rich secretory family protein